MTYLSADLQVNKGLAKGSAAYGTLYNTVVDKVYADKLEVQALARQLIYETNLKVIENIKARIKALNISIAQSEARIKEMEGKVFTSSTKTTTWIAAGAAIVAGLATLFN